MKPDAIFLNEALENLDVMRTALGALESGEGASGQIQTLFRCAHSIKGGAAAYGLNAVVELMHLAESVLDPLRQGNATMDPRAMPLLRQAVDAVRGQLSGHAVGARQRSTLVQRLQTLLQLPVAPDAGDVRRIIIRSSAPKETADAVASMFSDIAGLGEILSTGPGDAGAQEFVVRTAAPDHELLDLIAMHGERDSIAIRAIDDADAPDLGGEVRSDPSHSGSGARAVAAQVVPLPGHVPGLGSEGVPQGDVVRQRGAAGAGASGQLAPVAVLFARLPPLLEHLSARLHKPLNLTLLGQELHLDGGLLQAIADPLVQLVRNACDHGIEEAALRVAAGKPPAGQIRVSAWSEQGRFCLSVRDDGAGLSRPQLLQAARVHAIPVSDDIDDQRLWQLVFAPGLSTASQVSDVSGRGVGMDVVLTRVSALGGEVRIDSSAGIGTCMTISVPMGSAPMARDPNGR